MLYRLTEPSSSVTPTGRILFLLHGAAFTSKTWVDQVPTLQTMAALGHRVIAIDLPGEASWLRKHFMYSIKKLFCLRLRRNPTFFWRQSWVLRSCHKGAVRADATGPCLTLHVRHIFSTFIGKKSRLALWVRTCSACLNGFLCWILLPFHSLAYTDNLRRGWLWFRTRVEVSQCFFSSSIIQIMQNYFPEKTLPSSQHPLCLMNFPRLDIQLTSINLNFGTNLFTTLWMPSTDFEIRKEPIPFLYCHFYSQPHIISPIFLALSHEVLPSNICWVKPKKFFQFPKCLCR